MRPSQQYRFAIRRLGISVFIGNRQHVKKWQVGGTQNFKNWGVPNHVSIYNELGVRVGKHCIHSQNSSFKSLHPVYSGKNRYIDCVHWIPSQGQRSPVTIKQWEVKESWKLQHSSTSFWWKVQTRQTVFSASISHWTWHKSINEHLKLPKKGCYRNKANRIFEKKKVFFYEFATRSSDKSSRSKGEEWLVRPDSLYGPYSTTRGFNFWFFFFFPQRHTDC